MNLSSLWSILSQPLLPTNKDKVEIIAREIAERLRYNRQLLKRPGTVWDDEKKAREIAQSRRRRLAFWFNQRLISAERRRVEPTAKWVYDADLFKIIERLSPTLEALGVIAIPLVLFFATQRYQDNLQQRELEKSQQETVANYLNQMSTILLDVEGDLRDAKNERLRTLITAATLTLLRDPNLDGVRKGQVIQFLSQMELVNRTLRNGPQRPEDKVPIIRLNRVDLGRADLRYINLSGADLSGASLNNINLSGADLREANLGWLTVFEASGDLENRPDLFSVSYSTNLREANLTDANLNGAQIGGANLIRADLSGASLIGANLNGVILRDANLQGVKLGSDSQLEVTILCRTRLPAHINLDPDRDCETSQR